MLSRTAILSVAGPALLLVMGYVAWMNLAADSYDVRYFGIKAEQLSVTPTPDWINSDVASEVYEASKLGELSKLNRQASATIARAFDLHPWVKRTIRVRKLANSIQVDVEYRRPVAGVYVPADPNKPNQQDAAYPIDSDAIYLPSADFSNGEILNYFLIYAPDYIQRTPEMGVSSGDTRIIEAAALAGLLQPLRRELNLRAIYVYPEPNPIGNARWVYELETAKNANNQSQRFVWGHALGKERPGEPDAEQKIDRLVATIKNQQSETAQKSLPAFFQNTPDSLPPQ